MYAVIRVRGTVKLMGDIQHTLGLMRLNRVNHCVLVPDNPSTAGMLQKVKDYVTWGEIDPDTLVEMLEKRGRIVGNKPMTEVDLMDTDYDDFKGLADAIIAGEYSLGDPIKPVVRLHPPARGYEGIKKPFVIGGALGYRGQAINDLIRRML
jgi:large subunit ribosomal protein L30